jgi:hypothetical protein
MTLTLALISTIDFVINPAPIFNLDFFYLKVFITGRFREVY